VADDDVDGVECCVFKLKEDGLLVEVGVVTDDELRSELERSNLKSNDRNITVNFRNEVDINEVFYRI